MSDTIRPLSMSARTQATLWSTRARDWADVQEPTGRSLHAAVLGRLGSLAGRSLLDAGCGAGAFCGEAAAHGARATGVDVAAPLLEIARQRVPSAAFEHGELEALPFASATFDVVTGINSFQYAADPVRALSEARRVARPDGRVVVAVWGRADDCDAATYLAAIDALLPPPLPGAPGAFALSATGALSALVAEAGLDPLEEHDVTTVWSYPDEATALRGLLSAGPSVHAIDVRGEAEVRTAVGAVLAPFRVAGGGYRLTNTFRVVVART